MNIEELTEAMLNESEVIYCDTSEGNIRYKCIRELILWRDKYGKLRTSVLLTDYTGRHHNRTDPRRVSLAGEEKCQRDTSSFTDH